MIQVSGTGDTAVTTLYTSALANCPCLPLVRITAASNGATLVDMRLNGIGVQQSNTTTSPGVINAAYVRNGDVFTYEVSNSGGGTWTFQFELFPQGDVAL